MHAQSVKDFLFTSPLCLLHQPIWILRVDLSSHFTRKVKGETNFSQALFSLSKQLHNKSQDWRSFELQTRFFTQFSS
jgi:hypothetical protein